MVRMKLTAAKEQVNSLRRVSNQLNDQVDSIQNVITMFSDNSKLSGRGYTQAKDFGMAVVVNAWRALRVACEAIARSANKMVTQYESMVDTKSWSDEELDMKIQRLVQMKRQLMGTIQQLSHLKQKASDAGQDTTGFADSIRGCNELVGNIEQAIQRLRQIKNHLHEFDGQSASLIQDAQRLLAAARNGIAEMSNGIHNNGTISMPSKSALNWIDEVNALAEKYDTRRQRFIDVMSEAFGIDKPAAVELYKLQQGIERYANKHHKGKIWAVYEYNRIIACLGGYGNGFIGKMEWAQAGSDMTKLAIEQLLIYYGASPKILEKKIRRQHLSFESKIDMSHESVIIASLTNEAEYIDYTAPIYQKNLLVELSNLTTKTGSLSDSNGIKNEFVENVTYRGDMLSNKYSNSDFSADVDALNICRRIDRARGTKQALNVMVNYYEGISDGTINRKTEFLRNNGGWKSVNEKIDSWTPEDYMLRKYNVTNAQVRQAKQSFKNFLSDKDTGIEALFN
ncbi:T7SS effector LXG polymorphic toxin [Ligilactobacillus hohenheimensis]|uniref:T7SS effector LXG polymorphic toxin n=1 Tax=Ligilactobacillus hohenheimensis TaxID=2991832 RepID=UPI0024B90AA3|nr:T7SS effector LXG polymorphic toxin [Ligilactobacillus hohenheimensis]